MSFVGRSAELGRLRSALDRAEASLIRVSGLRGGGKSALVARAVADFAHVVHRASPFPDPAQRAALAETLAGARAARGREAADQRTAHGAGADPRVGRGRGVVGGDGSVPDWTALFAAALELVGDGARPFVLVVDDAHRLVEARSRFREALARTLETARRDGTPLHVVLVGSPTAPAPNERLEPVVADSIEVGPLPFRAACPLLPGARAEDLVRAYAVFGGVPRVLTSLDRAAALGTNVRRLMLGSDAVLSDAGGMWLERDVQAPARYYSILSALSEGEVDWATVHAGVPDLGRSGQVAPYLKRLEELGLVASRSSLDARPGSRARRYGLTDPFFAAWIRFVLAARASRPTDAGDLFASVVRPALDDHVARVFPEICRQHVAHDSIETLGASVRESGSLWGEGYDVPVTGILRSGSAFYGACSWKSPVAEDSPLESLDRQLRETRYGFGREHRIRLVFLGGPPPRWLQREIARRHDALVIDPAALVGAP